MLHPLGQKIKTIKEDLKKSIDAGAPKVAAFDADGTLWRCDVGELFFEHQIANRLIDLPADPWKHYRKLLAEHTDGRGYLWLAQINAGRSLEQVRLWAKECFDRADSFPFFEAQKEIISVLLEENVAIYVVSASVKWAVEPAARYFGIPEQNVLGVETQIENGLVTDRQKGPITWKQGKVEAIKAAAASQPFFCSGNSEGDLLLLEYASHHRLVISSAPPSDRNFNTERKMQGLARERSWMHLDFTSVG